MFEWVASPALTQNQLVVKLNEREGKRMEEVFFKYYDRREIESVSDKRMLDKLARAGHIEYVAIGGKAYAQATQLGRKLHYVPSSTVTA